MPGKRELSLLPSEDNANSFWTRFIKWVTTVGRVVIIFTELIVILAFVSRFWLDRQNSDLSETIRQQKAILGSTQEFETDYNSLQQRLKFISDFYRQQPNYLDSLNSLLSSLPDNIYFENFSIDYDKSSKRLSSKIELYTYQEDSLVTFINNLRSNPDIDSVDIQKIEKKTKDNKYYLNIDLLFKKNVSQS